MNKFESAEKGSHSDDSSTTPTVAQQVHPHHHTGFIVHAGQKIKHFVHPKDGRKIHIAQHPEQEQSLRRYLSAIHPETSYDIVIHGSPDHIAVLRESQALRDEERAQLRLRYGADFDRFERIIQELDHLNKELHMVSEHAVQLDANFEKFGYSAHLRTLPASGTTSSSSSTFEGHDHHDEHASTEDYYKAQKKLGQSLVFFKRPMMRQYFHKGLLWRSQSFQEVVSFELFVDLFYVGIIAIAGDAASETPNGESLLKFVVVFTLAWKFWGDVSLYVSWFDADDILRRIIVLFTLTCLLGFTVNIGGAWDTTWPALVSFYLAPKWLSTLYFLWMAYLIPMVRNAMISTAVVTWLPSAFYIASIHVGQWKRQGLIWPAIYLDLFGPAMLVVLERGPKWMGSKMQAWARKTYDFIPGANIEHKIERTNAFVALVFGYSVVALLYQSAVKFSLNAFYGKAVLFLIISFTYNWIYFEIDAFNMHTHAIRRHFWSSLLWLSAHLPFIMAYVLAGAALSKIVLAHDLGNASSEWLAEPYNERSEEKISQGLRWYFCGGLSVSMICMTFISMSHTYRTIPNVRLRKGFRLLYRFAVSIAILLLPLARESLNSLQLVGTCCALVVSILLLEIRGSASSGTTFWGIEEFRRRKGGYSARCHVSRKVLEENIKTGKVVNVEDLAKKEKTTENAREGFTV
ncbi:uncharacterized protein PV09_09320 [Verruconis gallopava]|uniref:Bacterial low temperature requirement A protein-domain-containing protein n=1 Tax=Verruconis gallopava TaxID=253628 RepID=A0A0D1ZXX7_9PEZI|nr:uncharacterized protein PV09_09320 [Verruconis gallopava]KIV98934.1 hypothetical protein PV09_09320 [Verruconis gallopava]